MKIYISPLLFSLSFYLVHSLLMHASHHSYQHVIVCPQAQESFIHKLVDILTIDIGINHLEGYQQSDNRKVDFHPIFDLNDVIPREINISIEVFITHTDISPKINSWYAEIHAQRGPPYSC